MLVSYLIGMCVSHRWLSYVVLVGSLSPLAWWVWSWGCHIVGRYSYLCCCWGSVYRDGLLIVLRSDLEVQLDSLGFQTMFPCGLYFPLLHSKSCYVMTHCRFTWCIPLSWCSILLLTLMFLYILRYVILWSMQYLMHMFYLVLISMD